MKILHILAEDSNAQDERNCLNMFSSFADLGLEQQAVIKTESSIEDRLKQMEVTAITTQKFGGIFDLRTEKNIQAIIDDFAPHIIQTYTPMSARCCDKKNDNISRIGIINHSENDSYTLSICDRALTFTPEAEDKERNIFYLPPLIIPDKKTPAIERSKLNTPDSVFLTGIIGPLTENTEIDTILKAIKGISGLYLWIADTKNTNQCFKDMTIKQGLHDRVIFIDQEINPDSFLQALDMCLIPNNPDNNNNTSLLQCWSVGVPAFSTQPAPLSLIEHKTSGWVADSADILKIRQDLSDLIENPETRKNLAQKGKELFDRDYQQQTIIKKYMAFYKDMLDTSL